MLKLWNEHRQTSGQAGVDVSIYIFNNSNLKNRMKAILMVRASCEREWGKEKTIIEPPEKTINYFHDMKRFDI